MKTIIDYSHHLLKQNITKNDIVLDLTVGNGNDTLFLVRIAGFVYGFDIQNNAIVQTKQRLTGYNNFKLINDSHEYFNCYIKEKFKAAIFNLGYLPGGDKSITTTAATTLVTVKKVLSNLLIDGICVLVVYPGHNQGQCESMVLLNYLTKLDQSKYRVLKYEYINQINYPPYLLGVRRLQ